MAKAYLGDSVYIEFDGVQIILTTENGERASNTIYLERGMCEGLIEFFRKVTGE